MPRRLPTSPQMLARVQVRLVVGVVAAALVQMGVVLVLALLVLVLVQVSVL